MKTQLLHTLLWPLILTIAALTSSALAEGIPTDNPAPPFKQTDKDAWINSEPLDWKQLRGKVVLLNVWTYGCSNCRRSIPWLQSMHSKYKDQGMEIIGIHSPEFAWEKPRLAVTTAVKHHEIKWPVMLDNELKYWRSLGNRYWPAFYIIDKQGNAAGYFIGETHQDDRQAKAMNRLIEKLLAN